MNSRVEPAMNPRQPQFGAPGPPFPADVARRAAASAQQPPNRPHRSCKPGRQPAGRIETRLTYRKLRQAASSKDLIISNVDR
jgi:hypothetical protein